MAETKNGNLLRWAFGLAFVIVLGILKIVYSTAADAESHNHKQDIQIIGIEKDVKYTREKVDKIDVRQEMILDEIKKGR